MAISTVSNSPRAALQHLNFVSSRDDHLRFIFSVHVFCPRYYITCCTRKVERMRILALSVHLQEARERASLANYSMWMPWLMEAMDGV